MCACITLHKKGTKPHWVIPLFTRFPVYLLLHSFGETKASLLPHFQADPAMAGMLRPGISVPLKDKSMRPPMSRSSTTKTYSSAPTLNARSQSGTISPTESTASLSTNRSRSSSRARQNSGKRKARDFDADGEETNIHVVVRCRGRNDREVRENSGVVASTDGVRGKTVELSMSSSALSNKTYHFDKVFSPAADQAMIYEDVVSPVLDEVRRL